MTQVLEGDRRFDVVVRFQAPFRSGPEEIARIPISARSGAMIPLEQVAKIRKKSGAGFIYREDNQRYIPLKFSVRDRDLTSTVLQGVLLVTRIKANLQQGLSSDEAVRQAGLILLRPVMMVAAAAGLGLLPAALSNGIGSETQKPLATVVVGGMGSCFFVILLLLPALYRCLGIFSAPCDTLQEQ